MGIFLAVLLTFVALRFAFGRPWRHGRGYDCGYAYGPPPYPQRVVDPREELRQRLARGDLTVEEYERRRDAMG